MNNIIIILILMYGSTTTKNTLETKFIDVPVDHFDQIRNATFKLRYLVFTHFHVRGGPILFFTGNEADINTFARNTGFLFDIAPIFNALVVFAEHRYYGQSLPFGSLSFSSYEHMKFLSTSQVLKDFVYIIEDLKKNYLKGMNSKDTHPIIAFGGSYGGILAAWLRMKYPHVVIGAIASSAPVWIFDDISPCDRFYEIITEVFTKIGTEECTNTVKKSWIFLRNITKFDPG